MPGVRMTFVPLAVQLECHRCRPSAELSNSVPLRARRLALTWMQASLQESVRFRHLHDVLCEKPRRHRCLHGSGYRRYVAKNAVVDNFVAEVSLGSQQAGSPHWTACLGCRRSRVQISAARPNRVSPRRSVPIFDLDRSLSCLWLPRWRLCDRLRSAHARVSSVSAAARAVRPAIDIPVPPGNVVGLALTRQPSRPALPPPRYSGPDPPAIHGGPAGRPEHCMRPRLCRQRLPKPES